MDLFVLPSFTIPAAELKESFSRASGPGGQHVNKTETKVELRWNVETSAALKTLSESLRERIARQLAPQLAGNGDLIVRSSDHRSQKRNRDEARRKLSQLVRSAARFVPVRRPTKPSRRSKERRLESKRIQAQRKKDRKWSREP